MLETIKKVLLAALGAMRLTPEEVRVIIQEFKTQGILDEQQEAKLLEALLGHKVEDVGEAADRLGREFQRLAGLIPLVSRSEFHELEKRIQKLEEKLGPPPQVPEKLSPSGEELGH